MNRSNGDIAMSVEELRRELQLMVELTELLNAEYRWLSNEGSVAESPFLGCRERLLSLLNSCAEKRGRQGLTDPAFEEVAGQLQRQAVLLEQANLRNQQMVRDRLYGLSRALEVRKETPVYGALQSRGRLLGQG